MRLLTVKWYISIYTVCNREAKAKAFRKQDCMLITENVRCPFLREKRPICLSNNSMNPFLPILLPIFLHFSFFLFLSPALEQTQRVHLLDYFFLCVCNYYSVLISVPRQFAARAQQSKIQTMAYIWVFTAMQKLRNT